MIIQYCKKKLFKPIGLKKKLFKPMGLTYEI